MTMANTTTATIMGATSMDDFLIRAAVAGVGVALVSGPVGCFVVWRRMSYFGATLAHAALLGVALGLALDVGANAGIVAVSLATALLLAVLRRQRRLPMDTLLGILAHGTLAAGLIALAFMQTVRVDLMAYLFGDILAVGGADLAWVLGGGTAVLGVLALLWRPLLNVTVHEDLAQAEGVRAGLVQNAFLLLIAVVIAAAMKVVGVLLIVSLLIVPAATARRFAGTPEGMAAGAAVLGALAVAGGLWASLKWDTPAGPSIVAVSAALFLLSLLKPAR